MSNIDQRNLLKAAAAGDLAMGAGVVQAAPTDSGKTSLTIKPGTYTANAKGISSEVTVKATFDAFRFTKVAVDVSGKTKGIGTEIGDTMARRFIKA